MPELALLGGPRAVETNLVPYKSIGVAERAAVTRVLDSGCLSSFIGAWCDAFDGGPEIKNFEKAWADTFHVKHAVSLNSATSGLYAAMGAIGISPGDEVIVPPYTMSSTALAPLIYGGIPVFADIDEETFCIDPSSARKEITERTKAIIAVNLFGHAARLAELRAIADEFNIKLIEDNAQAPFAKENGEYAGTIGHIGIFSLNYHKHIHTGEGGVCVTDDDDLALRLRMIRNHGENAVTATGVSDITNIVGFNYRLTELSAAIGLAQLENSQYHIDSRVAQAEELTEAITGLDGLTAPVVRDGCSHVYYVWAIKFDEKVMGISRATFSKALAAEGFPNSEGYVRPLYMLPIFQQRMAIGKDGFPFTSSKRQYRAGLCPIVERMHERELLWFPNCTYETNPALTRQFAGALRKVHSSAAELTKWESESQSGQLVKQ